jgi:transcriptional regulator with XRE-family HTH domain
MEEPIKDRIQKIMDAEQLSAAKFADTVGVQRSLVSHILNERNKPGTDIIIKILKTFPKVSSDWLFLGIGMMYRNDKQTSLLSLFDENISTDVPISNPEPTVLHDALKQVSSTPSDRNNILISQSLITEKKLEKIIVYYSDATFEEFYSNKK